MEIVVLSLLIRLRKSFYYDFLHLEKVLNSGFSLLEHCCFQSPFTSAVSDLLSVSEICVSDDEKGGSFEKELRFW